MIRGFVSLGALLGAAAVVGCGPSTSEKTAQVLSALTSMAQPSSVAADAAYTELVAEGEKRMPFASGCTSAEVSGSCTASSLSSVGCTTSGSVSSLPFSQTCTFSADATVCCGSTAFTVRSGSTGTWSFTEFSLSTSSLTLATRVQQDATVSGDGLTNVAVVCDYSQSMTMNFTELLTAALNAGVLTMSCNEQLSWYRSNVRNYVTLTITATSGNACTIAGAGVSASELQGALLNASQACYSPSS